MGYSDTLGIMYSVYKTILLGTLAACCSVMLTTAITAEPRSTPRVEPSNNSIVLPTSANGILSQCGDYFTFSAENARYGVVPPEYTQNSIPVLRRAVTPVFGYMTDKASNADDLLKPDFDINTLGIAQINRILWDGHTIIWVKEAIQTETYDFVKNYADNWNKSHANKVILVKWKTGKTEWKPEQVKLPQDRAFAFSSWGVTQSCMSFSEKTFEEYMEHVTDHNAGRDIASPPVAKLEDGNLLAVNP